MKWEEKLARLAEIEKTSTSKEGSLVKRGRSHSNFKVVTKLSMLARGSNFRGRICPRAGDVKRGQ